MLNAVKIGRVVTFSQRPKNERKNIGPIKNSKKIFCSNCFWLDDFNFLPSDYQLLII
jgi:hypothetical protein